MQLQPQHATYEVKGGAKCEEVMIPSKNLILLRISLFKSMTHCFQGGSFECNGHLYIREVIKRVPKMEHSLFPPFDKLEKINVSVIGIHLRFIFKYNTF